MNGDIAASRRTMRPLILGLIAARMQRGLSQRDVARMAGVQQQQIVAWESLTILPTVHAIARYAAVVGLGLGLFAIEPEKGETNA